MNNSEFLKFMTDCGVLLFGDFTLKSGRKSPYFINTGNYKSGTQISRLADFYADLFMDSGKANDFDVLFGPAYKGIPLATALACKLADKGLDLKVSYDRKERKDHGESGGGNSGASLLGYVPQDGDRIAIIEDVTTAGTSVREVISLLESLGINAKVTALFISVDRMEKGTDNIGATEQIRRDFGIEVYSIATTRDIVHYLESSPNGVTGADGYAVKMREYLDLYGC
ncbi:MAG: orotate phosphoribosyltransferase [Oscillospiraceae bacterium]|nr:orotate phosphoribosyltransferase [Oscillospiraceae bacterium]